MIDRARPVFSGARQLARLIPTVDRRLAVVVVVLGVMVAGLPVALSVAAASLVARAVHAGRHWSGGLVVLVVATPLLAALLEGCRQSLLVASGALGRRVDGTLRARAMAASMAPDGVVHLEDTELQLVFGSARNLGPFVFTPGDAAQQVAWSIGSRLQAVVALAVIAVWSPLAALVIAALWAAGQIIVIATVLGTVASTAIGLLGPDVLYLRDLVLTPPAAKEMRVFGLGSWASGRFDGIARARLASAWASRRGHTRRYVAAAACFGLAMGIGTLWLGLEAAHHHVALVTVMVTAACLGRVLAMPNIIADVPVAYGIFAIPAIARAEEVARTGAGRLTGTARLERAPAHDIELRGLRFAYPGQERPVLDHLDLRIAAGERVAIVGLSGSGKTTLMKLLCRLYDPDAGAVLVDGVDLREADPAMWRRNVSCVFQDFIHWQLSVSDNVRLDAHGDGGDSTDPGDRTAGVEAALRAAGALPMVERLPSGLATTLSATRTGGVDLSGGQWQRIALARALYAVHGGARLLILDEPTANLDPASELEFFDQVLDADDLRHPDSPITTLLISHRFPTVRHADRIVVLEEGRIVEDGSHDRLVAAGGTYARLFAAQAAAFAEDAP